MNIVLSHNYHVRNCSIIDPEFFEDPGIDDDSQSIDQSVDSSIVYRCHCCIGARNNVDLLAMETYKLTKACRKYKSKLEIIQEKISSIITENEASDDEIHYKQEESLVDEIPTFIPDLEDDEDFGDLPDLGRFDP